MRSLYHAEEHLTHKQLTANFVVDFMFIKNYRQILIFYVGSEH